MDYPAKAAQIWRDMNDNEKTGVRFGLFPADKITPAESQGFDGHKLVLALIDQAKADGGMRG